MRWHATWMTVIVLCSISAVLRGCGRAQPAFQSSKPEGYQELAFTVGGEANAALSHTLDALLDASATGFGNGNTLNGPDSIYDNVSVLCTFTFDWASKFEGIQITTQPGNCFNENECIICTATGNGTSACGLSCTGIVPSNDAVAADSFDVGITFATTVTTDMPAHNGTIRHDATTTGPGFNLSAPSLDLSGCDYQAGDHMMGISLIDPSVWSTNTPTHFHRGFLITALDPDTLNGNRTHCTLSTTFSTTITLAGTALPGTPVVSDWGIVTFRAKVCDYIDSPRVPENTSICTPP